MINFEQWEGFEGRIWKEEVNVRDFIQKNYTPYDGDESFLAGPTEATDKLWGALQKLQKAERAKGGVLDMETEVVSIHIHRTKLIYLKITTILSNTFLFEKDWSRRFNHNCRCNEYHCNYHKHKTNKRT